MVFLQHLSNVLSISSCILFLMMMNNLVFAGPTGLSLKLIHTDSPESPLYPGKLTQLERMERSFQQSRDHAQQLTSWMKSSRNISSSSSTANSKSHLDGLRPRVFLAAKLYMVEIGIGSSPNPFYYRLLIDTASDILWLQCSGNDNPKDYFRQNDPKFNPQNSHTYQPLPVHSTDPVCRKFGSLPVGSFCGYAINYGDGSSTSGILATETFTVNGDNGGSQVINNFVFGCGFRQRETTIGKNLPGNNPAAGILGLGGGVGSFKDQLGHQWENKFEYCLNSPYDNSPTTNTFLRFGSDTKIDIHGQGVQTTAIVSAMSPTIYYAIMLGISVGTTQVPYPDPGMFQTKLDGTSGSIFDSGCASTQFSADVYYPFVKHLVAFFKRYYRIKQCKAQEPFTLCFAMPNEQFNEFPTVTFHYSGADFVIEPLAVFTVGKKKFCLNIVQASGTHSFSVILGALQQVNHRILHDVGNQKFYWKTETCTVVG